MNNLKQDLSHFIVNEILNEPEMELSSEENLLSSGLIDSMSLMRLIGYIQEKYEISVPTQDIVIQNFKNISVLEEYILNSKANQ